MLQRMIRRIPLMAKLLIGKRLDAPDMLKKQHMQVELLIAVCRLSRDGRRQRAFERMRSDLEVHAEIEEQIFYPACASYEKLQPMIVGSYEEHQHVRDILNEMSLLPVDDKQFERCLGALFATLDPHVDKEENQLFPGAKRLMSRRQRMSLAEEMQAYRVKATRKSVA